MKKLFQILAGPIAFALMMLIPFGGLDTTARGAIGLLLWMLLWWIMQPVAPGSHCPASHFNRPAFQNC